MILLLIGLVAVIVVVLIAVFLSIKLGRSDEDDEPDYRSGARDRRRDQDERRERDAERVPSSARASGRGSPPRGRGGDYDGYGSRGPAVERDSRGRDYGGASRRPGPEAPGYRKPSPARSPVGASAAARGRHDTGPSRRPAADLLPADHPSVDFGPAGSYPAGDHPSVDFPAADYDVMDDSRDRPAPRRKAGPAPAARKGRSRQRGKRDKDDDWPTTEWDKLSDEQYWAELSADNPLASMARPSKPARDPGATVPANGKAKPQPAARESQPAHPPEPDLPGRTERAGHRGPATERLPSRAGARQAPPASLPPRREPGGAAAGRSYPDPHAVLDTGPQVPRNTGPHARRDAGPYPARDTGPQPREEHRGRDTGAHATSDRDLALRGGLVGPPPIPGALDDDPLTSPSFSVRSVPAGDSRSYTNTSRRAGPTGQPAADGTGSGGYPTAAYASPGNTYQAAPLPAAPPPAPAAEWYRAPSAPAAPPAPPARAHTPGYGNPYQQAGRGSPGGAADNRPAAYPSYLADPLHGYPPPGYQAPAAYPAPAAGTVPYADGYPGHPYPDQAGSQGGHGANGHAPGYQEGYQADPYAAGGYRPYPPQG